MTAKTRLLDWITDVYEVTGVYPERLIVPSRFYYVLRSELGKCGKCVCYVDRYFTGILFDDVRIVPDYSE